VRLVLRRRGSALASIAVIASGCAALVPTPTPEPTQLDAPAGWRVEVAVDNRSDDALALTLSQAGALGPSLILGPCEATSLIYPMIGPFTVGLGKAADFLERPMPPLVESNQIPQAGGEYRMLVRVNADGEVSFVPLAGVAPLRDRGLQC
jgi:hypothetical protein